jgi:hypothetical protein
VDVRDPRPVGQAHRVQVAAFGAEAQAPGPVLDDAGAPDEDRVAAAAVGLDEVRAAIGDEAP